MYLSLVQLSMDSTSTSTPHDLDSVSSIVCSNLFRWESVHWQFIVNEVQQGENLMMWPDFTPICTPLLKMNEKSSEKHTRPSECKLHRSLTACLDCSSGKWSAFSHRYIFDFLLITALHTSDRHPLNLSRRNSYRILLFREYD